MKILVLAESQNAGGIGRYCINLVSGLHARDTDISLMALGHPSTRGETWLEREARREGIHTRILPMRHRFDMDAAFRLSKVLRQEGIDILHSQAYRSNLMGRIAIMIARSGTRSVTTLHAIPASLPYSWRVRLYFLLDLLAVRQSAHAIAVNEGTRRDYIRRGLKTGTISVIYNGVPLPGKIMPQPSPFAVASPVTTVVGFVGRLTIEKGIDLLAEIIRQVLSERPEIGFMVAGDGPKSDILKALLAEPFGDRLVLVGQVDHVVPYYRMMHLIVMPSRSEGLPLVALEAMSHSLPVVATSVGGLSEVITNGVEGILTPKEDVHALTQAVIRIATDPELRDTMGQKARATVEQRFSVEAMCRNTLRVYERIIAGL